MQSLLFRYLSALVVVASATLAMGCRTTSNGSSTEAVFGTDDRNTLSSDNPFDSIGKLTTSNGGQCTVFMLAPRIGMTAGHCLAGLNNQLTIRFRGDGGVAVYGEVLQYGSQSYTGNVNDDWAIFVLTGSARSNQWLGYRAGVSIGESLHLSGFSVDMSGASTTDVCSAGFVDNNVLYHDCDMQAGASGGPIFVDVGTNGSPDWRVVGIQSGHHSGGQDIGHHETWTMSNSNLGCVLSSQLANLVAEYRQQYP